MNSIFPWQQCNWQSLLKRKEQAQLPHALLLTGKAGIGKRQFSMALAEIVLCSQPENDHACGQCASCQLLKAGTHPDIFLVEPEETGKNIKIDQIRMLINKLTSLKSHFQGGYKVAIIQPADAMNIASANSLLKTLEEPPANTLIILVTAKPSVLPATIRSRCQLIRMDTPSPEVAQQWLSSQLDDTERCTTLLRMSDNAPLAALQLATDSTDDAYTQMRTDWISLGKGQSDPVKIAEQWLKIDQNKPIFWSYQWVSQMIRLKQQADMSKIDTLDAQLNEMVQNIKIKQLYGLYDQIIKAMNIAHTQANHLMLLEGILLYWSNLPRQRA